MLVGPHPHSLLLLGSQTRSSQRPQALYSRDTMSDTRPMVMRSPGASITCLIRPAFTKVPFVLSKSRISKPAASAVSRQCSLDTRGTSRMKSAREARPMVLIAPDGTVVGRYESSVDPLSKEITSSLEKVLPKN